MSKRMTRLELVTAGMLGVCYGALIVTDSNFLSALQNAGVHQAALSGFGVYLGSINQTNRNCSIILLISEYTPSFIVGSWCILLFFNSN